VVVFSGRSVSRRWLDLWLAVIKVVVGGGWSDSGGGQIGHQRQM
jgi:hypothetical protein